MMKFERLGDLVNIQIGKTPKREVKSYWGKGHPWVSIADLKGREIHNTKEQITDLAVKECGCKLIERGTLLLSFKLSIGKIAFAGTDLYTNEAICGLKIIDSSKVFPEYLFYALKAIRFGGSNVAAKGSTLNTASLNALKIPFPETINDQIRIATILNKAEQLIQKRKEAFVLLDNFIKSTFFHKFGNIVSASGKEPLRVGLKLMGGAAFKSADFRDQGIPVIKIGTVNKGYFDLSTLSFLEDKEAYKKYEILPGQLLVSLTGTVGKDDYANTCFATDHFIKYYLNQRVAKIETDPTKLNLIFVHYLFKYPPFKTKLIKADKGIRQANLSNDDIYNFEIKFPPIELQNEFAQIAQKVEGLTSHFHRSLKELETVYGSLMQKAFSGDLDLKKLIVEYDEEYFASANDRTEPSYIDWARVTVRPKRISEMSLDEHYGIPEEIVTEYGSIETKVVDWSFFLKKHFSDRPVKIDDLAELFNRIYYEEGLYFKYDEFKEFLFKELKKDKPFLKQVFNEDSKQLELTIIHETSEA